jgi:hypothetical protein
VKTPEYFSEFQSLRLNYPEIQLSNDSSEMVGWHPDQGHRRIETAGVAALRRGFQSTENADMGVKMPFQIDH